MSLLAYALGAGKHSGGKPRVQWSADKQTLIYQGERLHLSQLRNFLTQICDAVEEILHKNLMFLPDPSVIRNIDMRKLVDDMNDSTVGYSFITDRRNNLQSGREKILGRLKESGQWSSLLKVVSGRLMPKVDAWRKYQVQYDRFKELLFILVHILGGCPARGREILTIRHTNTPQNMRNVFITDGQVMIVTAYHKSQAIMEQHKVISRFLPSRVGQFLVAYLDQVLPFATLINRHTTPSALKSFLWVNEKGIWDTANATNILTRETSTRLGFRITFQDYRHMAKAIDREHVRGLMGDTDNDQDHIHDLASAHSSITADDIYGIDASMLRSLSARTMNAFRTVSDRWHQFLHFNNRQQWARHQVRTHTLSQDTHSQDTLSQDTHSQDTLSQDTHSQDRTHTLSQARTHTLSQARTHTLSHSSAELPEPKRQKRDTNEEIQLALERLLGPGADFRSEKQRQALLAIWRGDSPLIVILPPAGGKSLLFQLPASLPRAQVTIVVVPFLALIRDLVKRCRDLGITCSHWTKEHQQRTQVVLVIAETAISNGFLIFASDLQVVGRLDRIVVDECHIVLIASEYRYRLPNLDRLRAIPCQFVLLTGSLPPCLEVKLAGTFLLGTRDQNLRFIRAITDRENVAYRVETCDDRQVERRVCELMKEARGKGQRAVVFCVERSTCERLAKMLECQPYHAAWEWKESSLTSWVDGDEKIMVATSALGTGVDFPGVRLVVHIGRPYGIIDFVQEVGRAGRDGSRVQSVVVIGKQEIKRLYSVEAWSSDVQKEAMRFFIITQQCRREQLGFFMDGDKQGKQCEKSGGEMCDRCCEATRMKEDKEVDEFANLEWPEERMEKDEEADEFANLEWPEMQTEIYQEGPKLWQQRVQQQGLERQRIEKAVIEIGQGCAACWVHGVGDRSHQVDGCELLKTLIQEEFKDLRRLIKFEPYSCCYRCSLPGEWCEWLVQGRRCPGNDVILPIAFAGWGDGEIRGILEKEAKTKELKGLMTWMIKRTQVGSDRGTNAVKAAAMISEIVFQRQ